MAGKNKVINTVLRLKDDMSGGLLQAAKNAKKAGAGITDEMMKSTRQVIAWKNKAISVASDAAKKIAAVGASAAGAAVTGLSAMAVKAGLAADDLNTLSKQSGFSTSDIQKWQYASDRIDVSVDDIVGAAKKMKKNMTSSSKDTIAVWKQLGVAVKNENGGLRDSSAVFYDTLGALSKVRNETERDTLAMTLFGKSADSLAGIVDDGGAALRDFGKEAEDAGLILSQDALDSANAFNDVLDTLKAKATGAFGKAGNKLATALLPAAERLGPILEDALNGPLMDKFTASVDAASAKIQAWVDGGGVERLASQVKNNLSPALDAGREALDFFRQHSDEVKTAVKILAGAFAANKALTFASNLISAGSTVLGFGKTVLSVSQSGLPALANGIHGAGMKLTGFVGKAAAFVAANPIVLGIAAAIAIGVLLYKNWDTVKKKATELKDFFVGKLTGAINGVKGAFDKAKDAVGGLIDKVKGFLGMDTNKTVKVKTEYASGSVGRNALGTSYWKGGLTRVNERGGEIMNLPGGTQIIPHDLSRKAAGGGRTVNVYVTVQGNVIGNKQFAHEVGEEVADEILRKIDNVA